MSDTQLYISILLKDSNYLRCTNGPTGVNPADGESYLGECIISTLNAESTEDNDISTASMTLTIPDYDVRNIINDKTKSFQFSLDQLPVEIVYGTETVFKGQVKKTILDEMTVKLFISSAYGELDNNFLPTASEGDFPDSVAPLGFTINKLFGNLDQNDDGSVKCYNMQKDATKKFLVTDFLGTDVTINNVYAKDGTEITTFSTHLEGASPNDHLYIEVTGYDDQDYILANLTSYDHLDPDFMFTYIFRLISSLTYYTTAEPNLIFLQNYLDDRGLTASDFSFIADRQYTFGQIMKSYCDSLPGVSWRVGAIGNLEFFIDDPADIIVKTIIPENRIMSLSAQSMSESAVNVLPIEKNYDAVDNRWEKVTYTHPYAANNYLAVSRQPRQLGWIQSEKAAFIAAKDEMYKKKFPRYQVSFQTNDMIVNECLLKPGDTIKVGHSGTRYGDTVERLYKIRSIAHNFENGTMNITADDIEYYNEIDVNRKYYQYPDINNSPVFRNWALTHNTVLENQAADANRPIWSNAVQILGKNSAYFDGTGYLKSPVYESEFEIMNDTESAITINIHPTRNQIEQFVTFGADADNYYTIFRNAAGNVKFKVQRFGVTQLELTSTIATAINTSYHILVAKNGLDVALYVDGVQEAQGTLASNATIGSNARLYLGGDGSQNLRGYINGLQIWEGPSIFNVDPTVTPDSYTPPTEYYFDSIEYN